MEAGSKITKFFKIRNNFADGLWTEDLIMRHVTGNIKPDDGQNCIIIPPVKPEQECLISIVFKIPFDIKMETTFFTIWRLFYKNKLVAKPWKLLVDVKSSLVREVKPKIFENGICQSSFLTTTEHLNNSDENIIYPACFNLDIPFKPDEMIISNNNTTENENKIYPKNYIDSEKFVCSKIILIDSKLLGLREKHIKREMSEHKNKNVEFYLPNDSKSSQICSSLKKKNESISSSLEAELKRDSIKTAKIKL